LELAQTPAMPAGAPSQLAELDASTAASRGMALQRFFTGLFT